MSFRTKLLARVDKIRRIPHAQFDLRQNRVEVIVRSWSGERSGDGNPSITVVPLYVGGSYNIKVSEVSSKDIVASNGFLTAQDIKIGPFTPEYPGGGMPHDLYDPLTSSKPQEVFYRVTGHGFPAQGAIFKRKGDDALRNFSSWIFLDGTGASL